MQYVYIRVSSADQNTARQEEALLKAGFQPDKIYVEHASAKDTNRPELQKLLEQLRPVDGRYSYFSEGAAYVQRRNKQSNAGVTVAYDVCIQSV